MHLRPQMPQRNRHSNTITCTEGTQSCTLDRDYPGITPPRKAQPTPRVHNPAPSTAITPASGYLRKANRHRVCTKPHPRNQTDQHPRRLATPDRHRTVHRIGSHEAPCRQAAAREVAAASKAFSFARPSTSLPDSWIPHAPPSGLPQVPTISPTTGASSCRRRYDAAWFPLRTT